MPRTEEKIAMDLDRPETVTAAQNRVLENAGRKDHDMHVEIDNGTGEKATVIIQSEMLYIVGIKNAHGTFVPKEDISYTKISADSQPAILEKSSYADAVSVLSKVEDPNDLKRTDVKKALITTIFLSSEAAKEKTARNATDLALSASSPDQLITRTPDQRKLLTWSSHLPVMQSWDKILKFHENTPSTMVLPEHVKDYYRHEFVVKETKVGTDKLKVLGVLDDASLSTWGEELTAKHTAEATRAAAATTTATAAVTPVEHAQLILEERVERERQLLQDRMKRHAEHEKAKETEPKRVPKGQQKKPVVEVPAPKKEQTRKKGGK